MLDVKTVASRVGESVGSVFGLRWGTEEPAHTVEDRVAGLEIRRYGPRIAAETTVTADDDAARNIGFRRLAGYIFGGNHHSEKIAMTAPVAQSSERAGERIAMTAPVSQAPAGRGESVIRFFMPARWTLDTLPEPNDPKVRLAEVPAETVAVLRFTGDRSPAEVSRRAESLLAALADTGYEVGGAAVAWFYDPPWTLPFRRRNEIAVPVTSRPSA